MLVHLSNISPYVCDLNRGPIEQANRMASAPTKKATALLEQKESFPKATRTPLKLLGPEEVPMDATATTTDINASLQPVWYTEQTIVDEIPVQQEDIASIIQEQQQQNKSILPRTTLPPIPSESPSIVEEEQCSNRPSLMHKSSTFTIEPSINIDAPLNDSEKENLVEEDTTNHIIPPSDDSFRALEHLLGLGSATTVRDSPKTNHDTLSLTVVTPTDIINSTSASLRMSYAPKNGSDSLPSSQELPQMPAIESITSSEPPSFLMDNTAMEEEQPIPIPITTVNPQTSFDITDNDTIKDDTNNDDETNFSFELNDFQNNLKNESTVSVPEPTPPSPPMMTIRAPTCADVAYRALIKPRGGGRVSQPVKADSPLAKTNKLRSSAPTSRMLRSSCRRISTDSAAQNSITEEQPITTTECFVNETETNIHPQTELIEVVSLPEEDENEQEKTNSVTLNLTTPEILEANNQNASIEPEQISTPTKPLPTLLSREYTYDTPKRRPSQRRRSMLNGSHATPIQQQQQQITINEEEPSSPTIASKSMLGILLTQQTEGESSVLQKTLPTPVTPSSVRASVQTTINEEVTNSPLIPSKSMLGILLTQQTEVESSVLQDTLPTSAQTTINEEVTNCSSIPSESMLGILLTKPTEAEPSILQKILTAPVTPSSIRVSAQTTINEDIINSSSIPSESMLGILLTKPTEAEPSVLHKTLTAAVTPSSVRASVQTTINEEITDSPSIPSESMLGILLTKPTEAEPSVLQKTLTTSIVPSPVRTSTRTTRKSERASSHPTPRVSINPLHSSTPSSSRHKSLQMVSIGEQEQVSTTVPQQINIEIQEEVEEVVEEEEHIEIVPLNDTEQSIQQPFTTRTNEIGIQTTPSLDVSSRRRLPILEQQTTPITQINKSSSSIIIINEEQRQVTPIQSQLIMNIKRNVRFQLTPTTDARLVAKEQIEETLRGLKPDIVIEPIPVVTETKKETVKSVKTAPIKKVAKSKPKRKVITSKKKKVAAKKPTESKQQPVENKTRQPRKVAQKEKPVQPTKDAEKKPKTTTPKRRGQRKQPVIEISPPTVRTTRKRTIPEATTKPVEPAPKRAKTSKSIETKPQPVEVPTSSTKTRNRSAKNKKDIPKPVKQESKTQNDSTNTKKNIPEPAEQRSRTRNVSANNKKVVPEPTDQPSKTRSRSANNKKDIPEPIKEQPKINVEPKAATERTKTNKRRLQSVDKNEGSKKKVEEEKIQILPPVQNLELSPEQRQKIEALTVAELKSRLNTHKEDIPKNAKKADLIALLIKIETNLLKEPKQAEVPTVNTTVRITRRHKK